MKKTPKRGSGRGKAPGRDDGKSHGAKQGRPGKQATTRRPGWMPEAVPAPRGKRGPDAPSHDPHAAREAQRYEQPIASREMILQVLAAHDGPMDAQALAEKLALTAPDRLDALNKRLGAMLRDGQLLQNRRGGFVPAERADLVSGTIIANPEAFASATSSMAICGATL